MPCHRSTPAGNFKLDGLMHGRLDLVARCITASFFVSYGVRRNTRYTVTLSDKERKHKDRTVLVNGAMVKHLRPDERSIGSLLHKLLAPSADDVSASAASSALTKTQQWKLTKAQRKALRSRTDRTPPSDPHAALNTRVPDVDDDTAVEAPIEPLAHWQVQQRQKTARHREEQRVQQQRKADRARKCLVGFDVNARTFTESVRHAVHSATIDADRDPVVVGEPVTGQLRDCKGPCLLLMLDEAAPFIDDPASTWPHRVSNGVVVVLGDNRGLSVAETDACTALAAEGLVAIEKVSLGPVPLLASQCIVLVHHYLDRLTHTCVAAADGPPKGAHRPTSERGQQCNPVGAYRSWHG
eukprot:m.871830 g.871830  ORF g.871830 m.871830 type:complete len:354 (+) comp23568_c0_seq65:129-1190(+)